MATNGPFTAPSSSPRRLCCSETKNNLFCVCETHNNKIRKHLKLKVKSKRPTVISPKSTNLVRGKNPWVSGAAATPQPWGKANRARADLPEGPEGLGEQANGVLVAVAATDRTGERCSFGLNMPNRPTVIPVNR